jgi:lysophospholipase L1-like esterase
VAWLLVFAGQAEASGSQQVPPTRYYVALGDSLSTGGGATPGHGYVNDVFAFASRSIPGLQLENLGCGGDSTARMINGGLCHKYATGTQLGDAEAFLAAHRDEVAFVTIDVGGDDIVGCGLSGTIDPSCAQRALGQVQANMSVILGGLRAAGGNVPIIGMSYYDPLLAFWLRGSDGQQTAVQSVGNLLQLNNELTSAYQQFGAATANGQQAFDSTNFQMTGSFNGQVLPQNVANICNWTHMCDPSPNIHANDVGHQLLANEFDSQLGGVVCLDSAGAYNQGFNAGFNAGYNSGFDSGFNSGFNTGFRSGFARGVGGATRHTSAHTSSVAVARGEARAAQALSPACGQQFNQGFNTGFNAGFNPGFQKGFDPGFVSGFNPGFNDGYRAGHHPTHHKQH